MSRLLALREFSGNDVKVLVLGTPDMLCVCDVSVLLENGGFMDGQVWSVGPGLRLVLLEPLLQSHTVAVLRDKSYQPLGFLVQTQKKGTNPENTELGVRISYCFHQSFPIL